MPILRRLLLALALLALTAPHEAAAQSYGGDMPRGADMQRGGGYRGGGGYHGGGMMRGGLIHGGMGLLPGLIGRAISEGQREPDRVRPPRPRRPVAQRPPPREKIRMVRPRPARPPIVASRAEAPRKTVARHAAHAAVLPAAHAAVQREAKSLHLPPPGETRFLPHEILVVFPADVSDAQIAAIARRQRLELVQTRDLSLIGMRVRRYRFNDNRSVATLLRALSRERKITWVEPHYLYALQQNATQPTPAPDKPPRSYSSALLHLTEAHQLATGKGVRVAVIDSLIDVDHPEILGSVAARFDALEGSGARPQLHGTGMASAIAGHGQLDGAAPDARILAVQAFGETDAGVRAAGLDILAGVDWAAAQKAQVINMSFAGPLDPLLSLMLAAAAEKNIALIAAAGNEGPLAQPQYPAADPHVIAVSAVDAQARVYAKANRGPYVALAAPGVDVLVAAPGGAYDLSTGTSVACAEVSGIAALLLEKKPDLDGAELRRLLQKSARPFDGVSDSGAGAANAETAVAGVR